MPKRFISPVPPRNDDPEIERVFRNHDERIAEIIKIPAMNGEVHKEVHLPDNETVLVAHGFNRPVSIFISPTVGATSLIGRVDDIRDSSYDRSKYFAIRATGFSAGPVTVDIWVL